MDLLRQAERPVCLVGSQYWWSRRRDAYLPFLETFDMPVFVNGMARGSIPPGHPSWMTLARKDALRRADVVMIFGTPLDFRLGYGKGTHIAEDAKLIQVDLDGGEIGRNRAIEVGIVGDTGLVMEQLTAMAKKRLVGHPTGHTKITPFNPPSPSHGVHETLDSQARGRAPPEQTPLCFEL